MAHKADMVIDFQYGSTGKGLIAGYLAKREQYDTVLCSFATNAGHTYVDESRGLHVMTQQLPTGAVSSDTVKTVMIGPGSLIHEKTLHQELIANAARLRGKRIMIHPHAAIVEEYHAKSEREGGLGKIGSTLKGVGAAMIERIGRDPKDPNIAGQRLMFGPLDEYLVSQEEWREALMGAENVLIEGAQGFGLSMYHGAYPYTTSRDVTPWQIAADCGIPYRWAPYIRIVGSARTFPIRVNNRDGSSGPCYPDQREMDWSEFAEQGIAAELTTVTKLKRRIFTFSEKQIQEAAFHCGGYWDTRVFLNFANYCKDEDELSGIIKLIQAPCKGNLNPPKVEWLGYGPDDSDVHPTQGELFE